MSQDWIDFVRDIDTAEDLIFRQISDQSISETTSDKVHSAFLDLRFLSTFIGYFELKRSHTKPPSPTSMGGERKRLNEADAVVFNNVAAAAKQIQRYLQHEVIDRFNSDDDDPDHGTLTAKLVNLWRTNMDLLRSLDTKLLHIVTPLSAKIAPLRSEIHGTYIYLSFFFCHSGLLHDELEPSAAAYDWNPFRFSLEKSLKFVNYSESQRKTLIRILNSLDWLLTASISGNDQKWSPWKESMMAEFGGILLDAAKYYCYCCLQQSSKSSVEQMAGSLLEAHLKMDPPAPEFLEIILRSLGHYDNHHQERFISSLVDYMIGLQDEFELIRKELWFLLTCLIKIPDQDTMEEDVSSILVFGIKDVVMEVRSLKYRRATARQTRYAILLAKIWSLKAEIFIQSDGTLLTLSKDNHVQALREGCRFLQEISHDFYIRKDSQSPTILKAIEGVPDQVESLYRSSLPGDISIKVSIFLFKSLVHMMLVRANELLLKLLNNNFASMMLPLKHKFASLQKGLLFLIDLVTNKEDEKPILADIEVVAAGVISVCNTFPLDNTLDEGGVKDMDVLLLDLFEKVLHLTKLRGVFQIPKFSAPKIPGFCFIQYLVQNVQDLLSCKNDSLAYASHQIGAISTNLVSIVSKFQDVSKEGIEKQEHRDLLSQLVDVAYQAEHAIGSVLNENKDAWQHLVWLDHLLEETKHIKIQLADSDGNNTYCSALHNFPQQQMVMPEMLQVGTATTNAEVMVGLNDHKNEIIDQLTRGKQQREIISIVGMPGIGKTTLANNVFCDQTIMYHFHVRAWSCVSQRYKKRDLLLDTLRHIISLTDNINEKNDGDLEDLLYKQLKGKRYLIVMDDMWSIEAWDDLRLSFPDDSNGSRILITSRLKNVVSKISDPHPLSPLSEEESWDLLKLKIFQKNDCPSELLEVGWQISRNCKGLPLAISAIAGLLKKSCRKRPDLWNQIADKVSSLVVNDPEAQCKNILELSYYHLPDHLKACLLYFGAFREDKDIPVSRLLWLWVAEGFVPKSESKSVEDLAEEYLMDLVGRSLVIVAERRSDGKVKACRVHDVVRDLCLLRAEDDNFLLSITAADEPYSFFTDLDPNVPLDLFTSSNERTYEEYRLCFCVNREHFVVSKPSGPFVRSLLVFAPSDMYPRCPYDVSFIPVNYRRLRVLDLESINIVYPAILSNLQNLESLLVKSLKSKVVLPETIWRMRKLTHICVTNCAVFTWGLAENENSSQLLSLVSLSFPCFKWGEVTDETMMRFPNLRILKCMVLKPGDISMGSSPFLAFKSLCKLESLNISYYGKVLDANELSFPSHIKKLTLSNFQLPWSQISVIGRLQNLEVLKLGSKAFEGSSWTMEEREFLNLKYLRLDTLNVVHWDASIDDLFPQLEQLVVRNCPKLKEIPSEVVYISTLEKIEVQQCAVSVEESVKRIGDEIEGLQIVISYSHFPRA
ncbi:OLC1v1026121C1 [Oldenlandia corymbosa var. corymbosa]|uniref:OLC1v1026121C1 n=1 Tax=Oldenlandia corymbosa var. corymbosa TaxID=529605 RepID=A0AAV1C8N4_OLDCO|nr:OLC1v1026121C1 [Oldenlandia corymbosa var. corymbosa]